MSALFAADLLKDLLSSALAIVVSQPPYIVENGGTILGSVTSQRPFSNVWNVAMYNCAFAFVDGVSVCTLHAGFGKSQHAALEEMTLQVPLRNPPTPSWIHDFPVTQHYAVLPETPVIFNLKVSSPL